MCDCETICLNSLLHRLSRLSDNEVSLNRHRYGIENTHCLQTTVVIECESRMLSNVFELYINFLIVEHACFATAFLPSFYSKNCERSSAPKYTGWAKKSGHRLLTLILSSLKRFLKKPLEDSSVNLQLNGY